MKEIWKEYKTYSSQQSGEYLVSDIEISNFGNVRGKLWNTKLFTQNDIIIINGRKCIKNHHNVIYHLVDLLFRGPLPKGYVVHHKDYNKLNDRLDNLERMSRSNHQKIHTLGKKYSKERNLKISDKLKHRIINNEWRKKLSDAATGYKWINNGIINKQIKSNEIIPEGFKSGMLKRKKKSKYDRRS